MSEAAESGVTAIVGRLEKMLGSMELSVLNITREEKTLQELETIYWT